MEINGIYIDGNIRVEKYPEPVQATRQYDCGAYVLITNPKWVKWESLTSANIADADKPYWEIEVDLQYLDVDCAFVKSLTSQRLRGEQWSNTQVQFTIKDNKAVIL